MKLIDNAVEKVASKFLSEEELKLRSEKMAALLASETKGTNAADVIVLSDGDDSDEDEIPYNFLHGWGDSDSDSDSYDSDLGDYEFNWFHYDHPFPRNRVPGFRTIYRPRGVISVNKIEYASSSRARCVKCDDLILVGSCRWRDTSGRYYHLLCADRCTARTALDMSQISEADQLVARARLEPT